MVAAFSRAGFNLGEGIVMVEGHIRKIDRAGRTAVIVTRDGKEVPVQFGPHSRFEVCEPASGGLQGGTLDDIGEGYLVQMEVHSHNGDGSCNCAALVSLS
jgi:hypothetical protein